MKKIIGLAAVLAVSLVIGGCGQAKPSQPDQPAQPSPVDSVTTGSAPAPAIGSEANNIDISGYAFSPGVLTIKPGETVVWTNNDPVAHQVRSAVFNSERFDQGQSFSFTFRDTGIFAYSCDLHPSMSGKIIVK